MLVSKTAGGGDMALTTVRGYLLVASNTSLVTYNTTALRESTAAPIPRVFQFSFQASSPPALFAASYVKINSRILPSIVVPFMVQGGLMQFVVFESLLPFQRSKPIDLSWVRGPLLVIGLIILIFIIKQRKSCSSSIGKRQQESLFVKKMDRYLSSRRADGGGHAFGERGMLGARGNSSSGGGNSSEHLDSIVEGEDEDDKEYDDDRHLMERDQIMMAQNDVQRRVGRGRNLGSGSGPSRTNAELYRSAEGIANRTHGQTMMPNEYDLLRSSIQARRQHNPVKSDRATRFLQSIDYGQDLLDDEVDPWR